MNGLWLMQATARFILTPPEQRAAIRIWAEQKGAQHQDSPCRGFVWYAGQSYYHRRHPSWLQGGYTPYRRNRRPKSSGWSWLWHIRNHCFRAFSRNKRCHPAQEEPKGAARIRPLPLQNQASCRERFSVVKTLEGDRYALCEKHVIVPFCCSYQVYRYLAGCFGLISCRHYLRTLTQKISSPWFWGVLDQCSFNIPYHMNIRRNWLKPVESGSCSRKQKSILKSCRKASRKANDLEMGRCVKEHTASSSSSSILSFQAKR